MESLATQRVGELIRAERIRRNMTIPQLARLAGVSLGTISKIENGKQAGLTLTMADRILTALDLRLHIETVPLWADIDESIDAEALLPLADRILTWPLDFEALVTRLDGIPYLLDGLLAAAVQGAPVRVTEFEIAVPRNDEQALDRLTFILTDIVATRGDRIQSLDPREPGDDYYTCLAGRLRIRLIDRFEPVLWVDIDPLPESEPSLISLYGLELPAPLRKARLAVVPLTEIQAADSRARRIIRRIAQRRATEPG
jgi:transcriptional regulator with XRE-family HTH domain